jgi:hypothetical protein
MGNGLSRRCTPHQSSASEVARNGVRPSTALSMIFALLLLQVRSKTIRLKPPC